MNRVFVDTSAVLALLHAGDRFHERAARQFEHLRSRRSALTTSSYVLVETYALLGRRHGLEAVRRFRDAFVPLLETVWVDRDLHEQGLDLLLARPAGRLSLVDAVSFAIIRRRRIPQAFAFDPDFENEGIAVL